MNLLIATSLAQPALPVTALDRLKGIPPEFWLRMGCAVVAVVALVFFLRKVAQMNKFILAVVVFLVVGIGGFDWIYERDEPVWATPVVSFFAGFLPTKWPPLKKPVSAPGHKSHTALMTRPVVRS